MDHPLLMWGSLSLAIVLGAFGQILMKEAMKVAGPVPLEKSVTEIFQYGIQILFSWRILVLGICYGLSIVFWLGVLSVADLSLARPIMSAGYLITLAYGMYMGESVTWERILGTFLIIAGLFFVAKSQNG